MARSIQRMFQLGLAVALLSVAAAALFLGLTVTSLWWWLGGLIAIAVQVSALLWLQRLLAPVFDVLEQLRRFATNPRTHWVDPEVHGSDCITPSGRLPEDLRSLVEELNLMSAHRAEALRRLLEERRLGAIDQRGQALRTLASRLAREIQTPLSGVSGFVERARTKLREPEQLEGLLTLIGQNAQTVRDALEGLLLFAQPALGAPEVLDLNALLTRKAQEHRGAAANRGLEILTKLAEVAPLVRVDRQKLQGALDTLIENAIEASEPGAAPIELSANQDQTGAAVLIVRDHGRGIPREQQHLVFTPYFTTKTTRGAGMRLAQAEAFARSAGGRIDFTSEPAEGTVFFITLKAISAEAASS